MSQSHIDNEVKTKCMITDIFYRKKSNRQIIHNREQRTLASDCVLCFLLSGDCLAMVLARIHSTFPTLFLYAVGEIPKCFLNSFENWNWSA